MSYHIEVGTQHAVTESPTVAAQAMAYELEGWIQQGSCMNPLPGGCDEFGPGNACHMCTAGKKAQDAVELLDCIAHFGHGFGFEVKLPFTLLLPDEGDTHSVVYQIWKN
jgi:hypothetical protein